MFGLVFGVVYVLVGLIGFFNDPILGVFNVNALHNIVHLLIGGALLFGSTRSDLAKTINLVVGIAYALVALLGFMNVIVPELLDAQGKGGTADDFLHLGTAALAIYFGTAGAGAAPAPTTTA
jgi:hypothetical protein